MNSHVNKIIPFYILLRIEAGCDRPRKNLLEEIKNKIRKIDIFSAIYINIKVVTTTNSKIRPRIQLRK